MNLYDSKRLIHDRYPIEVVSSRRRRRGVVVLGGSDNFNRADDATGLGTGWQNDAGVAGISSNRVYAVEQDATDFDTIATKDWGLANGTFAIELAVVPDASDYSGVCFRLTGGGDNVRVIVGGTGDATLYVQKEEAGTASTLGSAAHGGLSANDEISAVVSGSGISGRKNDVEIATGSSSFNSSATRSGVYFFGSAGAAGRLDNFSATP